MGGNLFSEFMLGASDEPLAISWLDVDWFNLPNP